MDDFSGRGGPTIYPATGEASTRSPWRLTALALLLMAVLGAVGGGWLVHYYEGRGVNAAAGVSNRATQTVGALGLRSTAASAQPAAAAGAGVVARPPANRPADGAGVAARVNALEERLGRISLAAESASGNAARAEALLVAFAARRAFERGLPLGTMEAQLRLRFGESQPNAVASILSASASPVTQDQLLQRLDALRPTLLSESGAGWFTRIGRGLSSLFTVRSGDEPSPEPTSRFDRARRAVESGLVDQAILEVMALPGAADPQAGRWLADARRHHDAMRALDLIETAAILEPGQNRGIVTMPLAGTGSVTGR